MDTLSLRNYFAGISPEIIIADGKQYLEITIPGPEFHDFCARMKNDDDLHFDYLISLTAVDWNDHFIIVCHLTSTAHRHTVVLKTKIDRIEAAIDTLSDIWKTAEYHEREVYDLFGITFRNHPDMRRLFLEDDYGFPLRKDFTDDERIITR